MSNREPFNHPDQQRAFETVYFERDGIGVCEKRTLIVTYDYGLSFDHNNPPRDYSFQHLVDAIKAYMKANPEIDRAELLPTEFALSRRD